MRCFAAVAFAVLFASHVSPAADYSALYRQVSPSVVVIQNTARAMTGGGVAIGGGRILTAAHLARGTREVLVITRKGERLIAVVLKTLKDPDLALLAVDPMEAAIPPAKVRAEKLEAGQELFFVGHPRGIPWAFSPAWVVAPRWLIEIEGQRMTATGLFTLAFTGFSGGGVFNRDGELVAILSALPPDGTPLGFAMPVKRACKKLIDCKER